MKRLRQWLQRWLSAPGTRRALAGLSLGTVLVLGAAVAQASGSEGHGGAHGASQLNWWTRDQHAPPVGWFLLDFGVFVGVFVYILRKPVKALFAKRHATIKQQIDEAQRAQRAAKAHHDEYVGKLGRVAQEIAALIASAQKDGELEATRIVANARAYAERLRRDADLAIGQESRLAQGRLYQDTVDGALAQAEALLRSALTDADRQGLLEQAIADLEKGHVQGMTRPSSSRVEGDAA